jgi:hypothetical protein
LTTRFGEAAHAANVNARFATVNVPDRDMTHCQAPICAIKEMLAVQTIHVFRCGTSGLYALTIGRSGKTLLPAVCCAAGWRFEKSIRLSERKLSAQGELAIATLAAIAKQGYYLTHAAIGGLPLAMVSESKGNPRW